MSLVNVAYSAVLTWSDPGREEALLEQLRAEPVYRDLFPAAFPSASPFTVDNVARALAAFERTIVSARSPYDRDYRGGDPGAISDSGERCEALSFTDPIAGCFRCHSGINFSDSAFHNTALYNLPAKFRTPTLATSPSPTQIS